MPASTYNYNLMGNRTSQVEEDGAITNYWYDTLYSRAIPFEFELPAYLIEPRAEVRQSRRESPYFVRSR